MIRVKYLKELRKPFHLAGRVGQVRELDGVYVSSLLTQGYVQLLPQQMKPAVPRAPARGKDEATATKASPKSKDKDGQ